jgi:hypothetical protein
MNSEISSGGGIPKGKEGEPTKAGISLKTDLVSAKTLAKAAPRAVHIA